jgi:hypothetical protein
VGRGIPVVNHEYGFRGNNQILRSVHIHQQLQRDLIEHIWQRAGDEDDINIEIE